MTCALEFDLFFNSYLSTKKYIHVLTFTFDTKCYTVVTSYFILTLIVTFVTLVTLVMTFNSALTLIVQMSSS